MDTALITALVGIITAILTFILTKKKYDEEVEAKEIKNDLDSLEYYKKLTSETIETQNKKIANLQKENQELRDQVNHLQAQVASLLDNICYDTSCNKRKSIMAN